MQLQTISANMSYKTLAETIATNFSILLDAYTTGANAMIFRGSPALDGSPGTRGASLLAVTKASFISAYNIIGDVNTAEAAYDDHNLMLTAILAIINNPDAFTILFSGTQVINTIDDLVVGDTLAIQNGRLITLSAVNSVWAASYTFSDDLLTTVTGMTRLEILAEIASVLGGQLSDLATITSVAITDENSNTVLPAFDPIKAVYPVLSDLAAFTYFATTSKPIFVIGNTVETLNVFQKLLLDSDMYTNTSIPRQIVIQDQALSTDQKYGILILDPANIADNVSLTAFANIFQNVRTLVMSCHAGRDLKGQIRITKELIELDSLQTDVLGLLNLSAHENYDIIATNATGAIINGQSKFIRINGANAFAANQSMGGYKLTSLAAGTDNGDAVNYAQLLTRVKQIVLDPTVAVSSSPFNPDANSILKLPTKYANINALYSSQAIKFLNVANAEVASYDGSIQVTISVIFGSTTGTVAEGDKVLMKTGGTMTGPIISSGDPVEDLELANKRYTDATNMPVGATFVWPGPIATLPNNVVVADGRYLALPSINPANTAIYNALGGVASPYGFGSGEHVNTFRIPNIPPLSSPVTVAPTTLKGVTISNGGSGYALRDIVGFIGDTIAYAVVTEVDSGAVTGLKILNLGSGFMEGHTVIGSAIVSSGINLTVITHTYTLGDTGGTDADILETAQMPIHNHLNGMSDDVLDLYVYGGTTKDMPGLANGTIDGVGETKRYQGYTSTSGNSIEHSSMQPFVMMYWVIRIY